MRLIDIVPVISSVPTSVKPCTSVQFGSNPNYVHDALRV